MGFLMGAFGKLMAGKRLRNLQFKLTQVTQQHSRITKQIALFEKQQQSNRKMIQAGMQFQMQSGNSIDMATVLGVDTSEYLNPDKTVKDLTGLQNACGAALQSFTGDSTLYAGKMQQIAYNQQGRQMQFAMATQMWDQLFEMQSESMLQPLKDAEESLQTEKDSLESQIKIAEADYEAQKKQEDAGAKNIAPNYTGQG